MKRDNQIHLQELSNLELQSFNGGAVQFSFGHFYFTADTTDTGGFSVKLTWHIFKLLDIKF